MLYQLILDKPLSDQTIFYLNHRENQILCKNKTDLSWIQKIIAMLGFGRFNLANIALKLIDATIFIDTNKTKILDRESFVDGYLTFFTEKLEKYNKKSFPRKKLNEDDMNKVKDKALLLTSPLNNDNIGDILNDGQGALDYISRIDRKLNYSVRSDSDESDKLGFSFASIASNSQVNWDDPLEDIAKNLCVSLWCLRKSFESSDKTRIEAEANAEKSLNLLAVTLKNKTKLSFLNMTTEIDSYDKRAELLYDLYWDLKKQNSSEGKIDQEKNILSSIVILESDYKFNQFPKNQTIKTTP